MTNAKRRRPCNSKIKCFIQAQTGYQNNYREMLQANIMQFNINCLMQHGHNYYKSALSEVCNASAITLFLSSFGGVPDAFFAQAPVVRIVRAEKPTMAKEKCGGAFQLNGDCLKISISPFQARCKSAFAHFNFSTAEVAATSSTARLFKNPNLLLELYQHCWASCLRLD